MTTATGPQNLSTLFKNFLKPEKDVSGHYSNSQFGITDIVFPDGWHGTEASSIAGLTVMMHPGNESGSLANPPLTQPQILLQAVCRTTRM